MVNVKRLYDYDGAFEVHLVIPGSAKGLAAEVTLIRPVKDETKITLRADPKATAEPRSCLVMRVVAALPQGRELIPEVKFAAKVVKFAK